jgi:hypothetical protein
MYSAVQMRYLLTLNSTFIALFVVKSTNSPFQSEEIFFIINVYEHSMISNFRDNALGSDELSDSVKKLCAAETKFDEDILLNELADFIAHWC